MKIGLLPCCKNTTSLYNIPNFTLPLKNNPISLLTNWCNILFNNNCEKIIIGSSIFNKTFIDNIINTELSDFKNKIEIKIIESSHTINNTIIQMLKDETYDIAIMGMPDTFIENISPDLINTMLQSDKYFVGVYLWNIRDKQIGKLVQCKIENNLISDIVYDDNCEYSHTCGSIVFKKEFEKYININELHIGYSLKKCINDGIIYENILGQLWHCSTIEEYTEYLNFMNNINKPIYIKGCIVILSVYINNNSENNYNCLLNCLKQYRNIYKSETIVVVDNNSPNTNWHELIKKLGMYLLINKSELYRYEIGAYNLALKYFRADKYICTQGNIYLNYKINQELSVDNPDLYAFSTIYNSLVWDNEGLMLINKHLNFLDMPNWENDQVIIVWNSFYCNNLFMEKLIDSGLLDLKCNTKYLSCSYERILGCFAYRTLKYVKQLDNDNFNKNYFGQ